MGFAIYPVGLRFVTNFVANPSRSEGPCRQVAATKELHGAIVASAKGEEPSLPTVEDNEVPGHIVRAKYEDDMAGRTLFKPKR